MSSEDHRLPGQLEARHQVLQDFDTHLVDMRIAGDGVGGNEDAIAVRRAFGPGLDSDVAVGAGLVFDDHLLAQAARQVFADDTSRHIGRAAGRERHDEPDRSGGPVLCQAGRRHQGDQGQRRSGRSQADHRRTPPRLPLSYRRFPGASNKAPTGPGMPYSTYLPEHMGSIQLSPPGPFIAGSLAELTLVYTAGTFGIDDTGMVKVSWRTTSDMAKPQFDQPRAANYTTVEASNGAKLDVWFDRLNIRPYANTLLIRVGRGYLRAGDTLTIRLGDRREGSPGFRLQTNVEKHVELKTSIDAFATYEFCELPQQPAFDLVAGPAASWKAIWPSLAVVGEPFQLAIVAEDMWGNPSGQADRVLDLAPSRPVRGLPDRIAIKPGEGPRRIENLVADTDGDLDLQVLADGVELARANPLRVAKSAVLRRYWGDLHGQSGETIGMGSAEDYFRYARDAAFIDMVGHQGNDFQITDAFWKELNELTAAFDQPGRFVCLPGYEWSGNTGMGGDRNIFYRREGRPIRRSSHILVQGETSTGAVYTADELFHALAGEDAVGIAHVGGRYADLRYAHDGGLERSVEVHSSWGTFEWLLHDAFEMGLRVGVVCHSDDHKGRPGATRPGASTFGAVGGLTCYFMPELTRDALFTALRRRHHYGTTGARMFIDLHGSFAQAVTGFSDDPQLGPAREFRVSDARMGDIVRPGATPMRLSAEVIGTAPVERVDVLFWNAGGEDGATLCGRGPRPPLARSVAGRGISGPRPRNRLAGQAVARRQPLHAFRPNQFPQSGAQRAGERVRHGAVMDVGDHRQSRRARPVARGGRRRHAADRNEPRVRHGRSRDARRSTRRFRRRRARPTRERLSPAGRRVGATRHGRAYGDVSRRRRPAGLYPRDPGRRKSGLDQPDISDRLSTGRGHDPTAGGANVRLRRPHPQ